MSSGTAKRTVIALVIALTGTLHAVSAIAVQSSGTPAEAPPELTEDATGDVRGFLYGRVKARRETLTGRIRWGDEEAFWDDHLNGNRHERPYYSAVPAENRGTRRPVTIFGVTLGSRWESWSAERAIVVRFGDVASIERRGRRHVLLMKSGTEIQLKGGSNDLRGELTVWDTERGETELDIDEIDLITFLPTPADLEVDVHRVYGTVTTTESTFEGFVIWDNEERLSTDILDGDDPSGKRRKIPLGDIRRIARRSSSSSELTLADGSVLVLDGTNDVDGSNRGIFVEDRRYGRVEIPWRAFDRVDFDSHRGNGRAYTSYGAGKPLRGTVETASGERLTGGVVYDVDESETWDILNGSEGDFTFDIPFTLISRITRLDEDSCRVTLAAGAALTLSDSTDVGGRHAGIVVLASGSPTYVPWAEVRAVSFE